MNEKNAYQDPSNTTVNAGESQIRYHSAASFMEGAITSSILESAMVTGKDAKKNDANKTYYKGTKNDSEQLSCYGKYQRIKNFSLTQELIEDMHEIIVRGTLEDGEDGRAGSEKTTKQRGDLYVDESVYRPWFYRCSTHDLKIGWNRKRFERVYQMSL